jgi:hypothetical protein
MTGFVSKRQAAQAKLDDDTQVYADRKRGSIALARSLCYQIAGAASEDDDISGSDYGSVDVAEILSAEVVRLQAALAQPEQEPVAWMSSDRAWMWSDYSKAITAVANIPTLTLIPLYAAPTQLEQEPVPEKRWVYGTPLLDAMTQDYVPAQRPWQGLTEWEREAIAHACGAMGSDWLVFVEAVEKALKEKNR